jgi:gluconolactonase
MLFHSEKSIMTTVTSVSSPTAEVRVIATGLEFPEGPIAMPDGSVLVTEIAAGTLARVPPDGNVERIAELGGGPNGAAIGPDGAVYVCNNGAFSFHRAGDLLVFGLMAPPSYSGGSIDRVDLATGKVTRLDRECDGHPLSGPNDIVFDDTGGFWFTDHGIRTERASDRTGVFYAQPDGSSIGQRIRGRARGPSRTAPAVDESTGQVAGGGVATHHDVGIAAILETRIEDRFAGRASARLGTLENQLFSTNPSDEMLY